MSLLTMVQTICEEVGLAAPNSVAGNTDRTAKQLMRLVNRTGRNLVTKPWPGLQKEYEFTTANGTADYAIPADVFALIEDTIWDRDNYWKIRGGLGPQEWQIRKSALAISVTSRKRFRMRIVDTTGSFRIAIDPTPTAAEDLVFEYQSNSWVTNASTGIGKNTMTSDDDLVFGIPEVVVEMGALWRFKAAKGLAYEEEKQEWDNQIALRLPAARVAQIIDMGGAGHDRFTTNVPETGFGA